MFPAKMTKRDTSQIAIRVPGYLNDISSEKHVSISCSDTDVRLSLVSAYILLILACSVVSCCCLCKCVPNYRIPEVFLCCTTTTFKQQK